MAEKACEDVKPSFRADRKDQGPISEGLPRKLGELPVFPNATF